MTHFQGLFIENLRFFRKKKGISQLKFSEMINISPNYLNAVENGKNFPSPEVIQQIADTLEVLPYQLFLEHPVETARPNINILIPELMKIKQQLVKDMGDLIKKCEDAELVDN
ncbi:MAG: helix-turn-helix domain-containing protein [Treponema sp.]|jgi:transcriptional regulator with XRE-family HTH domain|nr:helix-turn-helix domain-containing protein [Treponema sp.]